MIVLRGLNWLFVELAALVLSAWHVLLSPLFGCRCRFYPTCSQYAAEALRERGFLVGLGLGASRVIRCNARTPGGFDPVLSDGRKR